MCIPVENGERPGSKFPSRYMNFIQTLICCHKFCSSGVGGLADDLLNWASNYNSVAL